MVSSRSVLVLLVAIACGVAGGREVEQHQQRHLDTQDRSQVHQSLAEAEYETKSRNLKGSPKSSLPVEPYPVEYGYKSAKKSNRSGKGGSKNKGTKSHKGHKGGSKGSSYDGEYYEKKKSGKSPKSPKGDYDDDYGSGPKSSKKDKSDKVKKGDKGGKKDGYDGDGTNILDDDETMNPDRIIEEEIDLNLRLALRDGAGSFGGIEVHYPDLVEVTDRIAELAIDGVVKRTLQLRQKNRMLILEVDVVDTTVSDSFVENCPGSVPEIDACYGVTMTMLVEGRQGDVETFRGNMIDLFNSCTALRVIGQVNPRSPLYIPFLEDTCNAIPTQAPGAGGPGSPTFLAPTSIDRGALGGDDDDGPNLGLIIGPIAGGVVLLVIIGVAVSRMRNSSE